MAGNPVDAAPGRRSAAARITVTIAFAFACIGFIALGTWQVERRAWKLALIDRVEHRVHADAVDAPGAPRWPQVSADSDEYRHVRATGIWIGGHDTFVQASTDLGAGFWLLSPLRLASGETVLVNRGFLPSKAAPSAATGGAATVTGLLRMTEPGGGFLRRNDPAGGRWYSRDVQAIAKARGIDGRVAPYFIDAEASSAPAPGEPVAGLTVIAFHNSHVIYAVTWYVLALLAVAGGWQVWRRDAGSKRTRTSKQRGR